MKNRIISTLLILPMILSVLCVPVFSEAVSAEPVMKMLLEPDEDTPEYVTAWTTEMFEGFDAKFVLCDPDGSETDIPAENLTFSSHLEVEKVNKDGWLSIETAAVGEGWVRYTDDNSTRTVNVSVTYPQLGLYTGMPPFTGDTLTDIISIDALPATFAIALSPERIAQGYRITSVHTEPDNDRYPSITEAGTVTLSDDGSYAAVTVAELSDEDRYWFEATVETGDSSSETMSRMIRLDYQMPSLYFCPLEFDEKEECWEINYEDVDDRLHLTLRETEAVCFFFGTEEEIEDGEVSPLSEKKLDYPNNIRIGSFIDKNYDYPSGAAAVEGLQTSEDNTEITYFHNGVRYSLPVILNLPEVGFYTTSEPDGESYICESAPFVLTEDNRTFYLCVNPDEDHLKLTEIDFDKDPSAGEMFDVSVDEKGRFVRFTVKDDVVIPEDGDEISIGYTLYDEDEEDDESSRIELYIEPGRPELMVRYYEWDEETREYIPDSSRDLRNSIGFSYDTVMPAKFFYGAGNNMTEVDIEDLTFPAGVLDGRKVSDVIYLETTGLGKNGVITYSKDGITAEMYVMVRQPDYALYSSPTTIDETTYLGNEITLDGKDHSEFYLVGRDSDSRIGEIKSVVTTSEKTDVTHQFHAEVAADGSYAAFTVDPENMPAGNARYAIHFTVEETEENDDEEEEIVTRNLTRDFRLIRGDLQKLATPVNLVWHKEYSADNNANDRMGSMGYEVHGLCQNRFDIELYSSDDGYTNPVADPTWGFGSMDERTHFSVTTFIYEDLPSGTYKFRARSAGDGTKYSSSDWSEFSPEFVYEKPAEQLIAPDSSALTWEKSAAGRYYAVWDPEDGQQNGAGYFEVEIYYVDDEDEIKKARYGRQFDIWADTDRLGISDLTLEAQGATEYFFRVRVIPADITKYCSSEWSDYSPALDVEAITGTVNDKLENLLPDKDETVDVQDVQDALKNETTDLRTAMAADLDISGGTPSGTLELIRKLEDSVTDAVDQVIDAKNSAPQSIQDIASGITMVGAVLNLADKNPGTGKTPTVTLVLDQPKDGIVIDEQKHNAVQFSMKLKGAIDKDDKETAGQQLIVPVVIDMPVPEGINPQFLVVLHKLWDGTIEPMHPYKYLHEDGRWHACFVVDSFSDFALVEYNFRFDTDSVSKQADDAPFTLSASGCAEDSIVSYRSSDPAIASVNAATGEVTIHRAGTVTVTASASATKTFPETECSYVLTITESSGPDFFFPFLRLYSVKVEDSVGGTVRTSARYAAVASTVKLTVTPDEGYVLESLTITAGSRTLTPEVKNGTCSFVMHYADAAVKATFVKAEDAETEPSLFAQESPEA